MKKILLTTVATAVLATSSAYASQDTFYVKAQAGWSKMTDTDSKTITGTRVTGAAAAQPVTDVSIGKGKSENDVSFGVGVGYHVMDNVRVDLTFDHFVNPEHKKTKSTKNTALNSIKSTKTKIKGDVDTLMVNGFVDVFNITDEAKMFIGAGLGASHLKAKATVTKNTIDTPFKAAATAPVTPEDVPEVTKASTSTYKAKKKYDFAYAVYAGASYEIAPAVTAELTYSYRDMGKTKALKNTTVTGTDPNKTTEKTSIKSVRYRGHNVGAGVRFDI